MTVLKETVLILNTNTDPRHFQRGHFLLLHRQVMTTIAMHGLRMGGGVACGGHPYKIPKSVSNFPNIIGYSLKICVISIILSDNNQLIIGLVSSTIPIFLLVRFTRQILETRADILFKILVSPPPPP